MDLFTIQDFGVEVIIGLIITLIMAILIYIYKKFELQKFGRRIISSIRLLNFSTKCNLVIFILFISICLIIVISNSYIMNNPAYLKGIAPQFESIPCIYISTYAANGNVIHEFNNDKMKQERYIKLNLRNYGKEDDCNCGLIIAGLCGFDAKGYKNISFYAKGEYGGEKFGVKIKDLGNSESGVQANNYVDNKKLQNFGR